MKALDLTPERLNEFAAEERKYLESLGSEHEWDIHAVAYVEALKELKSVRYVGCIRGGYTCLLIMTGVV